jgi:hypothetical protein
MSKKESVLDLAKFIDKGVRVKLAGGREGELIRHHHAPSRAQEQLVCLQSLASSRVTTSY